jgi:hypothetical protein
MYIRSLTLTSSFIFFQVVGCHVAFRMSRLFPLKTGHDFSKNYLSLSPQLSHRTKDSRFGIRMKNKNNITIKIHTPAKIEGSAELPLFYCYRL